MFYKFSMSKKLFISGIGFAIPLLTLAFLMINAKNEPIKFGTWETYGNRYQRPLQALLEGISLHKVTAMEALLFADNKKLALLPGIQAQIDNSISDLKQVQAELGRPLQFTPEGLSKRKRDHLELGTVISEWVSLKSQTGKLRPEESNALHDHLIADMRAMITHSGDTSNLILDPDLDTYYLMDITLLVMPQLQDRLQEILTNVLPLVRRGKLTPEERVPLAVYTAMLKKADLERLEGDVATALNEDSNFYGLTPSLQKNVPPIFANFSNSLRTFIDEMEILSQGGEINPETFQENWNKAWTHSSQFFRVVIDEYDNMLYKRIQTYEDAKKMGVYMSILGLLLFIGLSVFIGISLTKTLNIHIATIGEAALTVQNSSQNISTMSLKLSDSTTEQASAIEETSSSMAEMSAMLNQTTKNSALTLSEAEDGQRETTRASLVISKMMTAMDEIHAANNRLESLVNLIGEIKTKTRVINNIVFETRLLSFNASIEAARAGVHGKGFAVVAEEVGKLAIMSGKAAEDIRTLLDSGAQEVTEVVKSTQERVQVGRSVSQECASAFESMSGTLGKITESVRLIAQSAKEQELGVKQTNKAMGEMDLVTHRHSTDAESLATQARSLAEGAKSLMGAIYGLRAGIFGSGKKDDLGRFTESRDSNVIDISVFRQNLQRTPLHGEIGHDHEKSMGSGGPGANPSDPADQSSETPVGRTDSRWKSTGG